MEVETTYFDNANKIELITARLEENNYTQIRSKKDLDEFLFTPPVTLKLLESIIQKLKFDLNKALCEGKIQDKDLHKLIDTEQMINFFKER